MRVDRSATAWLRRSASILAVVASFSACGEDAGTTGPDGAIGYVNSGAGDLTVAAASDLRPAFEELGDDFTEATGVSVTFSFGSSGQLREQIINGAPFDVYASASELFVDEVIDAGRADADTKAIYGIGRIVIVAADGVSLPADIEELGDARYRRIAIANPEHAPYGMAAREALDAAGLIEEVDDRLVFGENVSDTLRLVRSGNVDVAIVALSLVIVDLEPSSYVMVPDSMHAPLRQAIVATTTADGVVSADGSAFVEFVTSPDMQVVMNRFGFTLAPPPATTDG